MSNLRLIGNNADHADFRQPVVLVDQDLAVSAGKEHSFYAQSNKVDAIKEVSVAFQNETPVACGEIRPFTDTVAEIKRMFVFPNYRKQAIAAKILTELAQWAAEIDSPKCIWKLVKNNLRQSPYIKRLVITSRQTTVSMSVSTTAFAWLNHLTKLDT